MGNVGIAAQCLQAFRDGQEGEEQDVAAVLLAQGLADLRSIAMFTNAFLKKR